MRYSVLNLRDNPFSDITPTPGQTTDDFFWAGMPTVKAKIKSIYEDTLSLNARQLVLNWGPWGGGKTFSAYYFINEYRKTPHLYQAYIRSPKNGNKAIEEFFTNVIDYITFSKIHEQIQSLIKRSGESGLKSFLNSKIRSEEFSAAILLLGSDSKDIVEMMQRYLYSGLTKTELKKVGLPRNIETGSAHVKFLSGIILCFIGDHPEVKEKFILWIDEMEDLIYFSQTYYRAFSMVLRDLIDTLNEHFTVVINFTMAEPEESTVELLLGGALWTRINKKIRFKDFSHEDALLYCAELIGAYQIKKTVKFFPFDEQILKTIFDIIPQRNLTPREVNKYCGNFLNYALKSGNHALSKELVMEWMREISED